MGQAGADWAVVDQRGKVHGLEGLHSRRLDHADDPRRADEHDDDHDRRALRRRAARLARGHGGGPGGRGADDGMTPAARLATRWTSRRMSGCATGSWPRRTAAGRSPTVSPSPATPSTGVAWRPAVRPWSSGEAPGLPGLQRPARGLQRALPAGVMPGLAVARRPSTAGAVALVPARAPRPRDARRRALARPSHPRRSAPRASRWHRGRSRGGDRRAGAGPRVRRSTRSRPASTASRCTPPTATCSPSSSPGRQPSAVAGDAAGRAEPVWRTSRPSAIRPVNARSASASPSAMRTTPDLDLEPAGGLLALRAPGSTT